MPKRNREILMEQSLYDLLCSMNKRSMPHRCVLQLIDEKKILEIRVAKNMIAANQESDA